MRSFLAMMAHPGVTRRIGSPCFAANVKSRPVWAVNGGVDGKLRFEGMAQGETGYVLQQAVDPLPGSPAYRANVVVTL